MNNETRLRYDREYQRKQSSSRSQDVGYQYQDADLEQDIHNAQKRLLIQYKSLSMILRKEGVELKVQPGKRLKCKSLF